MKDAIAKKSKRPDVPKWENKCLIIVEFRKHLKDELLITSFTRVYANKQKILLNLWGDNKIYSDFDHLLESWPHVERPPQKLDRE